MFKRLRISLSRPKLAAFFIKDSWFRIIGYIFFIPLFLVIPLLLTRIADPGMSIYRYDLLKTAINEDFRVEGAQIVDGVLTYNDSKSATFDYFSLYIGTESRSRQTLNIVFDIEHIVIYINETELHRASYQEINLLNHDFSSIEQTETMELALALKSVIEGQSIVFWTDILVVYLFGLGEYLFIAVSMSLLMMIFIHNVQMPYKYRFKLSVYLSSIWIILALILTLFNARELNIISVFAVYIYHISVYRSIGSMKKRGT